MSFIYAWIFAGVLMAYLDAQEDPRKGPEAIVVFVLAVAVWPIVFLSLCESLDKTGKRKRKKAGRR